MAEELTDELLEQFTPTEAAEAIDKYLDAHPEVSNEPTSESNQGAQQQYVDYEQQNGSEQEQSGVPASTEPQQPEINPQDYSTLFQPFKAGGKEVQVRNLDEIKTLMQKGVDYTQKQQALKPRLAELRALEQNNMLDSNLNFAIDVFNGNPKAVAKLIKDRGIDINTLVPQTNGFGDESETDVAKDYVPNNYKMSEDSLKLLDVVDELKANNSYDKVSNAVVSWDKTSQMEFQKDPGKLLALSNHIQSGVYDVIMRELDHAKLVGSPYLQGKTDFEAYTMIGDAMIAQAQAQAQQQAMAPAPVQPQYQQPQYTQSVPQQAQVQNVQARKASVAPPRPTTNTNRFATFDPLRMSDEEFSKIDLNTLFKGY